MGSGLGVAPGWIHIDGNIHVLMAGAPRPVLAALHRHASNVRQWLPRDEYVSRLRSHTFLHYDLERGLPLPSNAVTYVYCSHVLEHFYAADARRLAAEMYRVLQTGGTARLCVPDLEHAVRLYQQGDRHRALEYFFTPTRAPHLSEHRYMYDFELMRELLRETGFKTVERRAYREGRVPDLEILDNRPEETLYVEATK
ncbi:MAG: methyltransferase domain-containing protein [Gemmatimonadota bacterium]